jgi:hypothetical protein
MASVDEVAAQIDAILDARGLAGHPPAKGEGSMKIIVALALLAASAPAAADVVTASSNGFEIRQTVPLVVKPEIAFSAFANLPSWWNAEHTYSGKAENLSLSLTPGGCFCESFPDGGGIEHMHVTYVDPGKRILMTGALGPLLYEATSGVWTYSSNRPRADRS